MELIQSLESYAPWNEQERCDCEELLRRLKSVEALYTRENRSAHLTASAWVVSPDRTQVLLAYPNLYGSWAWLGGHADGETNLKHVILKEIAEESGLTAVEFVTPSLFSLEVLTVDGHQKRHSENI